MKKTIFTFCMAMLAVMAINANDYTGTILVTRNGQTNAETATVTVTEQSSELSTMVLQVPFLGRMMTLNMTDVPTANVNNITTYSAERNVQTVYGMMYTIVFARVTDGMMAANVEIPAYGVTMWFNTVGDHFQLPNSDLEAWTNDLGEPDRWHGFKSADGTFATLSSGLVTLESSDDVRPGATGHSAVMTAGSVFGVVANGTMTNGRLMAGSMSATSTLNHAEMDKNKGTDEFYMPLYAKPDKFNVWLKYTQGTANANNHAGVSVKTFDGTYYQEPVDKEYTNLSGSIVGGEIPAGEWTQYSFPFDYDSYVANNAASEAIFVTFSTNGTPGQGSGGDALYVDDMKLVYLAEMTDLRYQDETIEGWNPAVTAYNMEVTAVPDLDDFTADITGVSAVLTKSMEQNADGTYRIAISAVAGDLQAATCYIITATVVEPQGQLGDVDGDGIVGIGDITALIDYILSGDESGVVLANSDVDADGIVGIGDITALIDYILSGNF